MSQSLGETPMTSFHTWLCMCEGVSRDSRHGMRILISCMIKKKYHSMCEMIVVCHCIRISGGEYPL